MDYVSCSPFRIPIARLAAAQAVVKNDELKKESDKVASAVANVFK